MATSTDHLPAQQQAAPAPDAPSPPTRVRGGGARVVVGLALLAILVVLALVGLRLAATEGWLRGGAAAVAGGAPGVFSNGQLMATTFRQAPDFTLQTFSGEPFRLSALRGQPVMINFWASWCPPCREEAPLLQRTWREYQGKGVVFVGVDIWDADQDARKFLKDFGITYPNGPDPAGQIAIDYGLTGIPETFFIDRQGQVVRKWIGPFTEAPLRAFLDEILASPAA